MKPMWKLILRCVCFVLPFVILGCCIERDMVALVDGEAPYYIWNREKANTMQGKKYRVVVLGDSRANASFVPEVLSNDTINLALGGTTPVENYYTLCDWLKHNAAPDICYISFSDSHFLREDCFWTRTMFSHRYSLKQTAEMLGAAFYYQEPSILKNQYREDFISSQLYMPKKYIRAFMDDSFRQVYESNSNAMIADELHGGRYIARGTNEYDADNPIIYEEFYVNPLFDDYYRKIIELCIENGITPRIIKLPLPSNSQFTDNFILTFDKYYESLQSEYPTITVDWPTKVYPQDCFVDGSHMNSHGALRFSTELKSIYPDDFSSSKLDEGQIAALDDSIRGENKIEWILKWMDGKDYTVLFYDKQGDFGDLYADQLMEEWGTGNHRLISVPVDETKAALLRGKQEVWAISGTGEDTLRASSSISVLMAEDGLSLQLVDKEPQAWTTASDDMLGVAVVNNYNHSIVCMKTFRYVDEAFQLAQ